MMPQSLLPKKILLAVTGSIAAYKSAELIRLLRKEGAEVRVVLTASGACFITPMTLQALSGHPVYQVLMDVEQEAAISHIHLARWADLILIMPCTANTIAKLAVGLADDLLSTICLATTALIAIAPAMNTKMWLHPATQANVYTLKNRNVVFFAPATGEQACGEIGEGCVMEPVNILSEFKTLFLPKVGRLIGQKILITAGPTRESIDPVRYLSNYSSGKMGYAIAQSAQAEGAEITLVSGPTSLDVPKDIKKIDVVTAQDMFNVVMSMVEDYSIFIATAAVADYSVANKSSQKIKKNNAGLQLQLIQNPDILAAVGNLARKPFIVGFAAETENVIENAKAKLINKKAHMIVANLVGENKGFQSDYNELTAVTENDIYYLGHGLKLAMANKLVSLISEYAPQCAAKSL